MLFEPLAIGPVTAKNRIFAAAHSAEIRDEDHEMLFGLERIAERFDMERRCAAVTAGATRS
ncbi:hypothetical protein [Paraburkholderia phenoliruptrix]|uniref:hypothetical protein n=1 Tax=Paraburkholderia phenoliruptrix TaxID=252970 RepID=UPI0034CE1537